METKDLIAIMQAYVDGKDIEVFEPWDGMWYFIDDPAWDWANKTYRIKPEPSKKPKVVPYESAEEFIQAQKECFNSVIDTRDDSRWTAYVNSECEVLLKCSGLTRLISFRHLFECYRWRGGLPCGKEVME